MKKDTLVIITTVIITLLGLRFFPAADVFQQILANVVFFIFLPVAIVAFVLRSSFERYGLKIRLRRWDLLWGGLILIAALIAFFLLYVYTNFGQYYYPPTRVADSFFLYCLYVVLLNGVIALCFAVFFYGFLLHGLKLVLFRWSVPATIGMFVSTLLFLNSFTWGSSVPVFFSIFAVALSYFTRNVAIVFLSSWFFAIIVDTVLLRFF